MALHLVGETIDKRRASYMAETGKLIQLMQGIYVDAGADIETTILQCAIRIAKYLYPRTHLSGASAFLLGPTTDGKLYISGPRSQRTRIRNLEIIQNRASDGSSLSSAIINDGMGEFKVDVSSIEQRFLESFRRRSEQSAAIPPEMRGQMANRVIEEYGDKNRAADALWRIARQNNWYWEGEQAERYLKREKEDLPVENQAVFALTVAWHQNPIGTLFHNGLEWRWTPEKGVSIPLVRQTVPGKLPPFIGSLLPEGWLETVLKNEDERQALRSGKRYMSNITIVEDKEELTTLPADILETRLSQYYQNGVFTGEYKGPAKSDIHASFEANLARIYRNAETPRLSGVQIKAPMYLDHNGVLSPSSSLPFTHIFKPAGTSGFEYLPVVEWLCLDLAQKTGFETPAFALTDMPDGMPPALVVERFDIRVSESDPRMIALEDFCSLLDMSAADKYKGTIEQAGRALRTISTEPEKDLGILLKRALFAWLIADGDMHLKNMALLKTAFPGDNKFYSVRMSPIYDVVTTVVFPGLKHDRMALKMNGKDDRLKRADFIRLAAILGLRIVDANVILEETLSRLQMALGHAEMPSSINYAAGTETVFKDILSICISRVDNFG